MKLAVKLASADQFRQKKHFKFLKRLDVGIKYFHVFFAKNGQKSKLFSMPIDREFNNYV